MSARVDDDRVDLWYPGKDAPGKNLNAETFAIPADPEIILNDELVVARESKDFIDEYEMPDEGSKLIDGKLVSLDEAAELGSVDGNFFGHYFFPKTSRQDPAPYFDAIWCLLDDSDARYISIQVFRGGAKTSILRIFTGRRIAYGLSNTILYLGKSEGHAVRSVEWLKRHIEFNPLFQHAFRLKKGTPWSTVELDIHHTAFNYTIRVLGMGIEGSVRGINVDDYRPDLIILDDVLDETNCLTPESIKKMNERIFGAIQESLAPRSENPYAKMVMLQTPIAAGDASDITQNDSAWKSLRISTFGPTGESAWPARWTTNELLRDKESAFRRNMGSVWLKEKECTVVADESKYFRWENVRMWDILPEGKLTTAIGIDPSPPNDEEEIKRRKKDPDPEVVAVVGIWGQRKYLLEYVVITDPDPDKTWKEFRRLARKWKIRAVGTGAVNYEKTLKWFFQRQMKKMGWWIPVHGLDDKRNKVKRIRQGFVDYTDPEHSEFYVHPSMNEFKAQYENYPNVIHDDILDAVDNGFNVLLNYELGPEQEDEELEDLGNWRACP